VNRLVVLALVSVLGAFTCWRGLAGSRDVSRDLAREAKRCRALDQDSYQCRQRIEAKQLVVAEVIAGRMGLARAARRFAEINAASAEETGTAATSISFADEEACSRSVLSWVRSALVNDTAQSARILPALEEAYRQSFQPVLTAGNGQLSSPGVQDVSPRPTPEKVAARQGPP